MERKTRDEILERMKKALGEEGFQLEFDVGAAMSMDQMLDLALAGSSAS
jgi:hypothetical protein